MNRIPRTAFVATSVVAITSFTLVPHHELLAQRANPQSGSKGSIPVESEIVVRHCASCHTRDSTGRMSRLSYMRKSPEGWQTSIRRMVLLNDVQLETEVAREIVRYLSNRHGLAPEELRPGNFEVERRMIDYAYEADEDTEKACTACHSMGRVITQRRTKEEWGLLVATHRGYYPLVDFQAFRRSGPPPEDTTDKRQPMEKAIDHLAKVFPLETAEWSAWSATMRAPRLAGTWALSGREPGKGPIYGRVVIAATPDAEDEFTTETTYVYSRGGKSVTRRGRAIVYTGFQWRGRSFVSGDEGGLREVMLVERNWREISGRWFTGAYDEFGPDVTLRRVGSEPVVSGVYPVALPASVDGQEVHIYGMNLPADLSPAGIDFGPGIRVARVVDVRPDIATVRLDVAADAAVGTRDLFLAGMNRPGAVVVFDSVDRIKVMPAAGMARVGGANFPKHFQQFEAVALHDGADGKPGTRDDLRLGMVDVRWSLEEYTTTYEDDDLRYVGSIDGSGLFTPALDGPNTDRPGNRNNVGDVWAVATYVPNGSGAKPIRARAHLLVTVPLYMRWEPWRVEQ